MTGSWTWSFVVWGAWVLLFLIFEGLGLLAQVPWRSLSATAWDLEAVSGWIKVLVLAGFVVLTIHIVFEWPK
jgi:hypothetical protein